MTSKIAWALPGLLLIAGTVACGSDEPVTTAPATTTTGGDGGSDAATTTTSGGDGGDDTGSGGDPGEGGSPPGTTGSGGEPPIPPDCSPGGPFCAELPGQAQIDSRMHSCTMLRYDTLGRVLADFGVPGVLAGQTPPNTTPDSAGELYKAQSALDAFGVAKEQGRVADKDFHTTASALKLFDIFVQAAEPIIAAMPTAAKCMKAGVGTSMFDGAGNCVPDAITCLIGYPATDDHTLLCDLIIDKADPGNATDVRKKKIIAVATLLAAAHTCE